MDNTRKEQLYEACQASRIPIVEDDVYHELLLKRHHRRLRPWIIADKFFILDVSKTLSPGLRIGWLIGPTTVIERLADIKCKQTMAQVPFLRNCPTLVAIRKI